MMKIKKMRFDCKKGVTLIEFLVAATILSLISIAMVTLFSRAFKMFSVTVSDIRGAQDAMFVFDEINSKLRMVVRPGWENQLGGHGEKDASNKSYIAPLNPYINFVQTSGTANGSDPAVTEDVVNDAVVMNLTTYRSNDETSDNQQKYGVFKGAMRTSGSDIDEIYVHSYKARVLSDFYDVSEWGSSGGSDNGPIASFIQGMMFEIYSSFDFNASASAMDDFISGATSVSGTGFSSSNLYQSESDFDKLRGVRTVVWIKTMTTTSTTINTGRKPLSCMTSIRYKDWQDW
ncbi:MAG TPA: prepilin-type N-terminal cleavage/methylation domain-containing protein [bacterium]|nr:prepilin-type N-terminal cleavage/methylation domain-containing protein [bacterium]